LNESCRFVATVAEGLADAEAGRLVDDEQAAGTPLPRRRRRR
jgi:predicted transcriptional regulator